MERPRLVNIAVIGLGKLGLGLASALEGSQSSKDYPALKVIGIDQDSERVRSINEDKPEDITSEPTLINRLHNGARPPAYTCLEDAVAEEEIEFDAYCILVPSPIGSSGFSYSFVQKAAEDVGGDIYGATKVKYVMINSTLSPGAINRCIIPAIEKESGKKEGEGFHVCYTPETVALGKVVEGFITPNTMIIGSNNPANALVVEDMYKQMVDEGTEFHHMTLEEAEIAKIALNCYLTTKISFANEIDTLCRDFAAREYKAGQRSKIDSSSILRAIGGDPRIGYKYLRGGLAYGGFCFPRDIIAYRTFAWGNSFDKQKDYSSVILAGDEVNNRIKARFSALVLENAEALSLIKRRRINLGIVGLAFTNGTSEAEQSPAVHLASSIRPCDTYHNWHEVANQPIQVYDPKATDNFLQIVHNGQFYLTGQTKYTPVGLVELVQNCDLIVICMPWDTIEKDFINALNQRTGDSPVVLDPWEAL